MRKSNCLISSRVKWNCFCRLHVLALPVKLPLFFYWEIGMSLAANHLQGQFSIPRQWCPIEPSAHPLSLIYFGTRMYLCISLLSYRFPLNIFRASFLPAINSVLVGDNTLSPLIYYVPCFTFSVMVDFINTKGRVLNCY